MTIETGKIAIARRNFYNDVMKNSRDILTICFSLLLFSLGGCAGNDSGNGNTNVVRNANQTVAQTPEVAARDDVDELGKTVKLPFAPTEAVYTENNLNTQNSEPRVPAPNDRKLVAVLKFAAADAAQISANAEKYKPPVAAGVDAEMWFPPELIAKSQESGDEALKGTEYAANDFVQSPYSNGKLTRINDTNYFVLELNAF